MRSYGILKKTTSQNRKINAKATYSITLPFEIAEKVPDGTTFAAEWHEAGILLRAIKPGEPPPWTGTAS